MSVAKVAGIVSGGINSDGFDDLLVGAFRADPNRSASGATYVIFGGRADLRPRSVSPPSMARTASRSTAKPASQVRPLLSWVVATTCSSTRQTTTSVCARWRLRASQSLNSRRLATKLTPQLGIALRSGANRETSSPHIDHKGDTLWSSSDHRLHRCHAYLRSRRRGGCRARR